MSTLFKKWSRCGFLNRVGRSTSGPLLFAGVSLEQKRTETRLSWSQGSVFTRPVCLERLQLQLREVNETKTKNKVWEDQLTREIFLFFTWTLIKHVKLRNYFKTEIELFFCFSSGRKWIKLDLDGTPLQPSHRYTDLVYVPARFQLNSAFSWESRPDGSTVHSELLWNQKQKILRLLLLKKQNVWNCKRLRSILVKRFGPITASWGHMTCQRLQCRKIGSKWLCVVGAGSTVF